MAKIVIGRIASSKLSCPVQRDTGVIGDICRRPEVQEIAHLRAPRKHGCNRGKENHSKRHG